TTIAAEIGATLVPVGTAWQAFARAHPSPDLYDRDSSHPSPAGSYLAACVFLAVLFDCRPVGLPALVPGLADADAERLQQVAWATAEPARGDTPITDQGVG